MFPKKFALIVSKLTAFLTTVTTVTLALPLREDSAAHRNTHNDKATFRDSR